MLLFWIKAKCTVEDALIVGAVIARGIAVIVAASNRRIPSWWLFMMEPSYYYDSDYYKSLTQLSKRQTTEATSPP